MITESEWEEFKIKQEARYVMKIYYEVIAEWELKKRNSY